jgi:hypothetical protein
MLRRVHLVQLEPTKVRLVNHLAQAVLLEITKAALDRLRVSHAQLELLVLQQD